MVYVDANYFIRLILKDIPEQYDQAHKLISLGSQGKIELSTSTVAFFEIYWVLSSYYRIPKIEIVTALNTILRMNFIDLPGRSILTGMMILFEQSNLGLEDCYHLCYAKELGASSLASFDKKLSRQFKRFLSGERSTRSKA